MIWLTIQNSSDAGLAKLETDNPKYQQTLTDLRALKELVAKFKVMNVDPTEYACLKNIIILKTGNYLFIYYIRKIGRIFFAKSLVRFFVDFDERQKAYNNIAICVARVL